MYKNKRLTITILSTILTIGILSGLYASVVAVNGWFETHRLVFAPPVVVTLNKPVRVEERKPEVIIEKYTLDYPEPIDTPLKKYICEKWGPFDCKTALAVFTAESGLREEAVHINNNDTIDIGVAQINTVHFKKEGCSLKEIVDAKKNVDCAYRIWDESDPDHKLGDGKGSFTPWVGFWNGNFKTHL